MRVAADELLDLAARLLSSAGAGREAARQTASSLVDADLRGHDSHGTWLVPDYAARLEDGRVDGAAAAPRIDVDRGSTVTVDAGGALGQAAAPWIAALAAERAREHGVAVIAVTRCGHLGRLFDTAEGIAAKGAIGIVFANDSGRSEVVAPFGGTLPRLATNPIAIGIPRRQPPHLVLDMATSVTSYGTLAVGRESARLDPQGSTDGGVLLPAAGAKGTGLALAVDVLAGVLTGAGHSGRPAEGDYQGILVVALDPRRFLEPARLVDGVEELVAHVKDGNPDVLVPGEAGEASRVAAAGWVQVPATTWAQLTALAAEHGIDIPAIEEEA